MRGKDLDANGITDMVRITPACAGKSPVALAHGHIHGDHPRMCGEKLKEVVL